MTWLREMVSLIRQYRQAVRDEKAAMQAWREEWARLMAGQDE